MLNVGSDRQTFIDGVRGARRQLSLILNFGLMIVAIMLGLSTIANSESLPKALSHAYVDNPLLAAEQARQRATDELEPQAKAGWRPTIESAVTFGHRWVDEAPRGKRNNEQGGVKIGLSQPLFRGFRTINQTKQARTNIHMGRQQLLATEQQVLLSAATAYMDVIRDREILRLRRGQVNLLKKEYRTAQGRFRLGETTRTDVEQSRARLNRAIGNMEGSVADLATSVSNYTRAVGHAPGVLKRPRVSPRMPKSLKSALAHGERLNPELLAALQRALAADILIDIREGELLPSVSLQAEYAYENNPSSVLTSSEEAIVRGVVSFPIYQAGVRYSRIRQAKHEANRKRMMALNSKRKVRNKVIRLWSRFTEAGRKRKTSTVEIGSAMVALQGVRREASFGQRTTLDILDAERELLIARERLEVFRRDQIVRAYEVIAAVGGMTASNLRLSVAAYDPLENYDATRNRWFGTGVSHD